MTTEAFKVLNFDHWGLSFIAMVVVVGVKFKGISAPSL